MKKQVLVCVFFVLIISGCRRKPVSEPLAEVAKPVQLTQITLQDGERPNEFRVHILSGSEVFYKIDDDSEIFSNFKDPVVPGLRVDPGKTMLIHLGEKTHNGFRVQNTHKVSIPKDCVLSGKTDWQGRNVDLEDCHRIFFLANLQLQVDDHIYNLRARKMVFEEGAQWVSFPAGARWWQHGRNGPTVSLQAEEIAGALDFRLNGENGSSGRDAKTKYDLATLFRMSSAQYGVAGENGFNSGSGGSLTLRARVLTCTRKPIIELAPGVPGQGGRFLPKGGYQYEVPGALHLFWVTQELSSATGVSGEAGILRWEVPHSTMCN